MILPYIHNPTPTIIAKMIIPTIKDANHLYEKYYYCNITLNAIILTIRDPIVPAKPKQILPWITNTINYKALLEEI